MIILIFPVLIAILGLYFSFKTVKVKGRNIKSITNFYRITGIPLLIWNFAIIPLVVLNSQKGDSLLITLLVMVLLNIVWLIGRGIYYVSHFWGHFENAIEPIVDDIIKTDDK